jgi:hypothetical protein
VTRNSSKPRPLILRPAHCAVRRFRRTRNKRSRINLSGLLLEAVLRAIMNISAPVTSSADRPWTGHEGHREVLQPGDRDSRTTYFSRPETGSPAFVAQSWSLAMSHGRIFFAGVLTTVLLLGMGFVGGLMLAKTAWSLYRKSPDCRRSFASRQSYSASFRASRVCRVADLT